MTLVTILWVLLGIGVVVLILWWGGIIGGSDGNGTETTISESNGGNGDDTEESGTDTEETDGDDATAGDGSDGDGEQADSEEGDSQDASDEEAGQQTVFTAEQADRGQEVFSANCAQCHGGQLDGDPPLTGGTFASTWEGMPVNALYEVISQTMPQDNPGSLDAESYTDVTAHILAFNGMPDGDSELQAGDDDALQTLIALGGDTSDEGDNGDATADSDDGDGEQGDGDETADSGQNGDGDTGQDQSETADSEENGNGDGAQDESDTADSENGEEQQADAEEDAVMQVEAEQVDENAQPGDGEGWIEFTVQPSQATVNILGPSGYIGQTTGQEEPATITGLEPGNYILVASLGNFDHQQVVEVRQREIVRAQLIIDELANSADLSGNGGQTGEGNGGEQANGEDGNADSSNGDNQEDANGGNGDNADENSNGDQAEGGNGDGEADSNDNNGDSADNGDGEAWYTEEQAETGAEDYSASCASCHGEDGSGGSDPPLADGALEGSFGTVWELFDYTSTEMPDDDPGSLDEETYVNIVAHLLALNDYPAGEEELEADEEQMSDMSLEGGNGGGNGEEQGENGDTQDGGDQANGEEADTGDSQTALERGQGSYSSSCAMCHGASLEGTEAPPLAGPVFMERWGGHPVNWLYFQAYTSMPPHSPGSLDDQAYTDIIVYILSENGVLGGDEEFRPRDPRLEALIIGTGEQQDFTLEHRINELRRTLHEPFEEAEQEDPEAGAGEVGVPETETADESADENGDSAEENGDGEGNGNGNGNDDTDSENVGGEWDDDAIQETDEVPAEGPGNVEDADEGDEGNGGNGE